MIEVVQQLSFGFEDLQDETGFHVPDPSFQPAPVEVVDAFLTKMMQSPERFSEDFRRLGRKFGAVLLPKPRVAEISATAKRLQQLVEGIL